MFTVVHEVPGRIRLAAPEIRTDPARAASLRQQVFACPGVTRAEVRLVTGSVIVYHDGAPESRNGVLRSLGLPASPYRGTDAHRGMLDAIIETTIQTLVEQAARAMLATVL